MKRQEYAAVAEAFAAYAHASKPTTALTHKLLDAIAVMIAVDHATCISILMHGLAIVTREPTAPALRERHKALF